MFVHCIVCSVWRKWTRITHRTSIDRDILTAARSKLRHRTWLGYIGTYWTWSHRYQPRLASSGVFSDRWKELDLQETVPLPLPPSFVASRSIRPREQRPASPNSSGAGKGDPGGFRVAGALRGFATTPSDARVSPRAGDFLNDRTNVRDIVRNARSSISGTSARIRLIDLPALRSGRGALLGREAFLRLVGEISKIGGEFWKLCGRNFENFGEELKTVSLRWH